MSIESRYVDLHPMSRQLADRARVTFPDGVTHDLRHNAPFSLYVHRAAGSRKTDVDGNELIDYVMGHGALLLGHTYPAIASAVAAQLPRGTHLGASHELEIVWGELVRQLVPCAERVRFTSSGTEATMMAVRLARNYTGRERILRLKEHFHGWNDSVTGQPGSEGTVPVSPGLPPGVLDASVVIPQDDVDALERAVAECNDSLAAMILEPTGAHWGEEPLSIAYVKAVREITARRGILLIFDEVITGFRVSPGGAQEAYGITPDMSTFAKIVAGGLPGGCVAGRADILDQISIGAAVSRNVAGADRIAHPGTFNANPLSSAAGAACLREIADGQHQARAAATAATLAKGLNEILLEACVDGCVYGYSSMLHIALGPNEPPADGYSWHGELPHGPIVQTRGDLAHKFHLAMLNEGVHLMGSGMMVSSVHDDADVGHTLVAFRNALSSLAAEGAFGG